MDVNKEVRLFNFALNVKKQHLYYYSTAESSMMNIAEAFTNGQSRVAINIGRNTQNEGKQTKSKRTVN